MHVLLVLTNCDFTCLVRSPCVQIIVNMMSNLWFFYIDLDVRVDYAFLKTGSVMASPTVMTRLMNLTAQPILQSVVRPFNNNIKQNDKIHSWRNGLKLPKYSFSANKPSTYL